jgi:hypothetical protein
VGSAPHQDPTPGGWDPSAVSDDSKSEQVKQCMDLVHCLHWLHLEPTHLLSTLSALAALGAHSPILYY